MLNSIFNCVLTNKNMGKAGGIWLNIPQTSIVPSYSRMVVRFAEVFIDIYMIISKGNAFMVLLTLLMGYTTLTNPIHDISNRYRTARLFTKNEIVLPHSSEVELSGKLPGNLDLQNPDSMISQHYSTVSSQLLHCFGHGASQAISSF